MNAFRAGEAMELKSPFRQELEYNDFEYSKQSDNRNKNIGQFFEYDDSENVGKNKQKVRRMKNNINEINYQNTNKHYQSEKNDNNNEFHHHNSLMDISDQINQFQDKNATGSFNGSQYLTDELKYIGNPELADISASLMSNNTITGAITRDFALNSIRTNHNNMIDKFHIDIPPVKSIKERTETNHNQNILKPTTNRYMHINSTFADMVDEETNKKIESRLLNKTESLEYERNKVEPKSPFNKSAKPKTESSLYKARQSEMKTLCGVEISLDNTGEICKSNQGRDNIFTYHNNDQHVSFDAFKEQSIIRKFSHSPISPCDKDLFVSI